MSSTPSSALCTPGRRSPCVSAMSPIVWRSGAFPGRGAVGSLIHSILAGDDMGTALPRPRAALGDSSHARPRPAGGGVAVPGAPMVRSPAVPAAARYDVPQVADVHGL